MKTAIIFTSKHGATEKVANQLSKNIANAEVLNLKEHKIINLSQYQNIILGSSIYAGRISNTMQKFIKTNTVELLQKNLALYICCMHEAEAEKQFNAAFPELLKSHSLSNQCIGGEFNFEKMNFFEKFLVKKISGVSQTTANFKQENINKIVESINNKIKC